MTAAAGIGITAIGAGPAAENASAQGLPAVFTPRQHLPARFAAAAQNAAVFAARRNNHAIYRPRVFMPACFDFVTFV